MGMYDVYAFIMLLNDHPVNSVPWYYDLIQLKYENESFYRFILYMIYPIEKIIKVLNGNILHNQYSFVEFDYKYLALSINF